MRVNTFIIALWLMSATFGVHAADTAPDAELLEFLGNFETKTGQWPELNELLAKRPSTPTTAPPAPGEKSK